MFVEVFSEPTVIAGKAYSVFPENDSIHLSDFSSLCCALASSQGRAWSQSGIGLR